MDRVLICFKRLSKMWSVKHAGDEALDQLDDLIARLRKLPGLSEKKRESFIIIRRPFFTFMKTPRDSSLTFARATNSCAIERKLSKSERGCLRWRVKNGELNETSL